MALYTVALYTMGHSDNGSRENASVAHPSLDKSGYTATSTLSSQHIPNLMPLMFFLWVMGSIICDKNAPEFYTPYKNEWSKCTINPLIWHYIFLGLPFIVYGNTDIQLYLNKNKYFT